MVKYVARCTLVNAVFFSTDIIFSSHKLKIHRFSVLSPRLNVQTKKLISLNFLISTTRTIRNVALQE